MVLSRAKDGEGQPCLSNSQFRPVTLALSGLPNYTPISSAHTRSKQTFRSRPRAKFFFKETEIARHLVPWIFLASLFSLNVQVSHQAGSHVARSGGEGRASGQPLPLALAVALETLTQEDSSSLLKPQQRGFLSGTPFPLTPQMGPLPVLITCYQLQRLLRGIISIIA